MGQKRWFLALVTMRSLALKNLGRWLRGTKLAFAATAEMAALGDESRRFGRKGQAIRACRCDILLVLETQLNEEKYHARLSYRQFHRERRPED